MPLSDIVDITITTQAVSTKRDGFGVPLILSANASFPERTRTYSSAAALITDGFSTSDPEYIAANIMLSQSPRVKTFMLGRLALPPTQRWAITPVAASGTVYKMDVDGNEISITSDSDATVTEIIAALKTAIDALSLDITVSDQTTYMRIVADNAGDWHSISVDNPALLGCWQDHADPGVATDLAAIALESNEWYGLINLYNSKAMADAIAGWVESNSKLFIAADQDTRTITVANGSDSNSTLAKQSKSDSRARTAVIYHPENGDFADAAWMGATFSQDPGAITFKFKELSGVTTVNLTATHITNLEAKNCNYYYDPDGTGGITAQGMVAEGEWIDVIRDRDWLQSDMQAAVYNVLRQTKKTPFTDVGIASVKAAMLASFQRGVAAGFLAADPEPVVEAPLAADVSDADKAARLLPDVSGSATLAGAIHLTELNVTLSL